MAKKMTTKLSPWDNISKKKHENSFTKHQEDYTNNSRSSSRMPQSLQRRQTRARNFFSDSVDGAEGPSNEEEENLLAAATMSDLTKIRKFVKDKGVNFNCTDLMGRTPLRLAVENEDVELLKILMPFTTEQNIMYALLDSLDDRKEAVAIAIIKHDRFLAIEQASKESEHGDKEAISVREDVTPIIVAAQKELYETVKLLLVREYTVTLPHDLNCLCMECKENYEIDSFRFAHKRLNIYRALASETYISLNSQDPILDSFRLRQKLLMMGEKEKHFRVEYHALAEQLSNYVVKLLDKVYGSDELDIIINKTGEAAEESYDVLARVKLAVKYQEKKFVAHPSCQMRVSEMFYSGFPLLKKANFFQMLIILLGLVFVYPILAVAYIIVPKTAKFRFMRAPVTKFFANTYFFLIMLCLIFYSTIDIHASQRRVFNVPIYINITEKFKLANNVTSAYHVRDANLNTTQIMILIWVIGLVWKEVKDLYISGWRDHFSSILNWIDILMGSCYVVSYALRIYTYAQINNGIEYFKQDRDITDPYSPFALLMYYDDAVTNHHYYWTNPDRFHWNQGDALIMSEVLFAVANVMDFARITTILPAFEGLGPLQISFSSMLKDIFRFMGLFAMVFLAFAIGLANLYWFYDSETRISVALQPHGTTAVEQYFSDVVDSLRSCFWSIFGLVDPTVLNVDGYSGVPHDIVQISGSIIYGVYLIICIIILFNLLIAMMTLSYDRVESNSDVEWKFARTELYFEYMGQGATLPVPLNLIPTPKSLYYLIRRILCCNQKSKANGKQVTFSQTDINATDRTDAIPKTSTGDTANSPPEKSPGSNTTQPDILIGENKSSAKVVPTGSTPGKRVLRRGSKISIHIANIAYKVIIDRVVKRFINDDNAKKEDKQDDIENIRQDLFRLRRELGNALELRATEIKQTRSEVKETKTTVLHDLKINKDTFHSDIQSTHTSVDQILASLANLKEVQEAKFQELMVLSGLKSNAQKPLSKESTVTPVAASAP